MMGRAHGWLLAFSCALAVHALLLLSVNPAKHGSLEKPAGAPVAVSGSLASILGGETSAEASEPETVEPVETKVVDTTTPLESQSTKPAKVVNARNERSDIAARSVNAPMEATSSTDEAIAEVQAVEAATIEEIKPVARREKSVTARKVRTATRTVPKTKTRRLRKANKTTRTTRRNRRKLSSKQRRAGDNRSGAAGSSRGGKGGKGRASNGAIQGYAARVRARILSRRPGAAGRGRVVISFAVTTAGRLRYASISRGSGNASLDRAALAAVRRASPFPKPPGGATARQLRFAIPFSFR